MGDGKAIEFEAIGCFRLLLMTDYYLDLKDTFPMPSFRWNLIFISTLDKFNYHCSFENCKFSFSLNSNILSSLNNLYMIDKIVSFNETLHYGTHGLNTN